MDGDKICHYYASVEAGQKLPDGIEWEVIENLFIPDDYSDQNEEIFTTKSGKVLNGGFIEELVDKAMEITGNEDDMQIPQTKASKWRPAGNITYYDEMFERTIGLEGIEVKARRWFTTHKGYADAISGYYSCNGRFKRPANYSFKFERYEFEVRSGGFKITIDGPKKTGNWNVSINRGSSDMETKLYHMATIYRAAFHYYYKNIGGLRRPPQNSFWRTQMKLDAKFEIRDDKNGNFNSARRFLGFGSAIHIYNPYNACIEAYATTIHELAHVAHWRMIVDKLNTNRYRDYHNAEDKMVESWACGVQYYLTRMVYPNYRGRPVSISSTTKSAYTNVVIDLIDTEVDHMAGNGNNGRNAFLGDSVEGYQMWQIQNALIGANTWNTWRDNIKKNINATKHNVDTLFASW